MHMLCSSMTFSLLAVAVSACAEPPAAQRERSGGRVCEAQPAQFARGQELTPALIQDAQRRSGASRVRVQRPGEFYTKEFDERRLMIEVDAGNRVLRVACG